MTERSYPVITVTDKAKRSLDKGHMWVYADEVLSVSGEYENGTLVDVRSQKGTFLGTGFINDTSKIRIRVISKNANDRFDEAFWTRRVKYAIDYRRTVMGADFDSCRLIFGEADSFPGLTLDKFGDVLVAQVLSLGIEKNKDIIFKAAVNVLSQYGCEVRVVYERNDVAVRSLEGMEQYKDYYSLCGVPNSGDGTTVITENGIKYEVDYINGQKTGFFLDQKYNRLAASRIATGKRVLDCFTHTGSFALNCAAMGADHVTAVDISESAIEQTKKNARLNGLEDKIDFVCANVFELLTDMYNSKKCDYDYIILDPPAFTKSRATVESAKKGYKEINLKAMRLLPRGGYLATCSCSHFMSDSLFRTMLSEAARDAGVTLRQIEARQQSCDHPILPSVPETDYLKFYIFQIV